MAKSQALVRAEALIENQALALRVLEDKLAAFAIALASSKAATQPQQPVAPAAARQDDWIPNIDVITPMLKRPPLAVFDDREAAWEYRNQIAPTLSHPVAVGWKGQPVRSPAGPVWLVY